MLRLSINYIRKERVGTCGEKMQRINVMISDESKAILLKYQDEKKLSKQDDALDMLIKERRG